MAINSLKKTLLFTSEENKNLVDVMVDDESEATRVKTSAILEEHLINSLLTENKQVAFWIKSLYKHNSIGIILSCVFEYNASGDNWKSIGLDLQPFLTYAINEQIYASKTQINEEQIPYLIQQLDIILEKFQKLLDDSLDFESKTSYSAAIETLKYLKIETSDNPQNIPFKNYYLFTKKYWEVLKDWTFPFRLLSVLAELQQGWRNDGESRYNLTILLRNIKKQIDS